MASYHPLLNALVAPQGNLPSRFRGGVGPAQNLPHQLGFGPVFPGAAQHDTFSGGSVPQPMTMHPTAQPGFSDSAQAVAGGPAASSLAPFLSTPHGGPATGPVAGAATEPTPVLPGLPPKAPTPNTLNTALASLLAPQSSPLAGTGPGALGVSAGGFRGTPGSLLTALAKYIPSGGGGGPLRYA